MRDGFGESPAWRRPAIFGHRIESTRKDNAEAFAARQPVADTNGGGIVFIAAGTACEWPLYCTRRPCRPHPPRRGRRKVTASDIAPKQLGNGPRIGYERMFEIRAVKSPTGCSMATVFRLRLARFVDN